MTRLGTYLLAGKRSCGRALAAMAVACLFGSATCEAIIYVNQATGDDITGTGTNPAFPYATIQKAVAVATNGETVYVAPGAYYPTASLAITNRIIINGTNGAATTIVDAGGAFRCATVTTNATLANLTFTGGHAAMGGGVFLSNGGIISNCIINANTAATNGFVSDSYIDAGVATNRGGGIFINRSGFVFDSLITNNMAANDGGGVFINSSGQVLRCTISGNQANRAAVINDISPWYGGGGGVYILTNGLVMNSLIAGNTAKYRADGGGIYCSKGGLVSNCTIIANHCGTTESPRYGGGLLLESNSRASCCIVKGNSSGGPGGGVYADTNSAICDSVILGNSSDSYAGGIDAETAYLTNCTVIYNTLPVGQLTPTFAGGLYASNCLMRNMIVYFNTADFETNYALRVSAIFSNSCTIPLPPTGTGNTTSDPKFIDFPQDFHIGIGSSCTNSGFGRLATEKDVDGQPRMSGLVDIGADEYTPSGSVIAKTTGPYVIAEGSPITLSAANSTGTSLQYRWAFGDGSDPTEYSTSAVCTHTYMSAGSWTGRLLIVNTLGQSLTNFVVAVSNVTPRITLVGTNYTGTQGIPLLVTASATHPIWNTFQYRMHFATQGWSAWTTDPTTQALYTTYTQITNDNLSIQAQKYDATPEVSAGFGATGAFYATVPSFASFNTLSGTPMIWLNSYGLTNDTSDNDSDGMATWEEYLAGTNPTNASSVFGMNVIAPVSTNASQMSINWRSASNRWYDVYWLSNLVSAVPPPMSSGIPATPPINAYTDTFHSTYLQGFYFIKAKLTP